MNTSMKSGKIINVIDKITEWTFYVLIAAVTFSTSLVETAIAIIIVSYFLRKFIQKVFSLPKHLFLAVFVLFIFWNLISFFNSSYLYESVRGLIKVIKYGLLLTITIDTFKSKQILKRAVYVLIIWSLAIALNGFVQNVLGFGLIRLRTINPLDCSLRISSSFRHSNNFGAYLVLIIPIFLSFIFSKGTNWRNRIYYLFGLMPLLYCVIRTCSRGAWLALFVAILILGLLKSRKLFAILIVLVIILPFFLPQQIKSRAFDALNFQEGTSWERLKLWNGAFTMIKERPFLGFGVNTYTKNFPAYKPKDYWSAIYPHNSYLHMATEIGLIGLGLFLTFIILAFAYISRHLKFLPEGWMRSATIGLFAGSIGFLIHSGVDTHLYSINLAVMFYLLLGFCIALCNYARINPA